jgi:hypothetical protein
MAGKITTAAVDPCGESDTSLCLEACTRPGTPPLSERNVEQIGRAIQWAGAQLPTYLATDRNPARPGQCWNGFWLPENLRNGPRVVAS